MIETQTELARSIEAIVGADHITEQPSFQIDGLRPTLIARPGSVEEVAACLKVCSKAGAAVVPAGRMTWLECGNPLKRAEVVMSLERMRRIVQYSPPDLTATLEAGLTLDEFSAVSLPERQWLPLDPPGFESASLGAIAACNSSGALRLGFGTPRDYVIGLKLLHADGTESKSGGQVVKNVAGYDMNKLYVGSYGTLAIITELTFKLRPLAERISTMIITSKARASLLDLPRRVLTTSELQPASVVLIRRLSAKLASSLPDDALLIRFIDSEAAVEHQVDWVMRAIDDTHLGTVLNPDEADAVWAKVADLGEQTVTLRFSVPLSAVPAEFEKALAHLECVATADIGAGIIRIAFDADERAAVDEIKRLRSSAVAANGSLVIERAPVEIRREADAWGDVGTTAGLMRTIKARFDPHSLLNPGKFVLGI